jgi:hypothetical protein
VGWGMVFMFDGFGSSFFFLAHEGPPKAMRVFKKGTL